MTLGAPAFAFVLALAQTATPVPGPGWVVLQRDGSVVQLMGEPERKGALLVGKLFPEGNLVSIRVEDVDDAKTAAANRQKKGALDATPPQPLVGGATALGDQVRLAPPKEVDAAHRELAAARKALANALVDRDAFEQGRPASGPTHSWTVGLAQRNDAVEKARLRVDRARKRVDALDARR